MALLQAGIMLAAATQAAAQTAVETVPSSADGGRFRPENREPVERRPAPPPRVTADEVLPLIAAPLGADTLQFTLRELVLRGATKSDELKLGDLYAARIGQQVTLAQMYALAAQITQRYREAGYGLSYAYIPDQEIASGKITIGVAEGYVGHVVVEGDDPNEKITRDYIARITGERPIKERSLESVLLRLNDLPGINYRAVLLKNPGAPLGEVSLALIPTVKSSRASVGFDNFGSRYVGTHEVVASYSDSLLPGQQTSVTGVTSVPLNRLQYGAVTHGVVVAPDLTLEGMLSLARSKPGYTLESLDIDSLTRNVGAAVNYQLIRQRNENLLLRLAGEFRHAATDVFNGTTLSRDEIRMVKATANYDRLDSWQGETRLNAVITQGIQAFGASKKGDRNLTRGAAEPDFTKLELSASRVQALGTDWSVVVQASSQLASAPLYASEEYGFGGQTYGRAYDSSEIVGDEGAAASAELRYSGWRTVQPINIEPFIYYDIGFVTNKDTGQKSRDALSSAGAGVRFATTTGQSGMVGVAVPLTRDVTAPIYGSDASSARLMVQIAHNF